MIIKICGIQNPVIARKAVELGAHWIGIVFYSKSRRWVDMDTATYIAHTVFESGGIPIAVFANASVDEILTACGTTGIRMVQLHGIQSIQASESLPKEYPRIYGMPASEDLHKVPGYPERDFILFDAACPGSGEKFNWTDFHYEGPYRWILAGGLTSENVALGIQSLNPFGVDVSSGVENEQGKKTIEKINAFMRSVV